MTAKINRSKSVGSSAPTQSAPLLPSASASLLRAAIYARKSNDDSDKNEENKSVTRQVDRGKAYASSKGWAVSDEHVYVDDGISGAEFKRRPGLLRMLNHLKQFDVVVTSELSRIGREQTQTAQVLAEIYNKGRRVFFYLTDEELRFTTAVDKFMVGAVSFGAEIEREKASQRARDALERKAAKGYNPGGACYGYDNVPVFATNSNGEQVKSHTDYKIREEQADIIRGIFRAYADGHGHTVIAKALNGNRKESVPKPRRRNTTRRDLNAMRKKYFKGCVISSPRRGKRGTGSWAPSAIREILYRKRYCGKVPFGSTVTNRPDLRIVDDLLWQRVQNRLKEVAGTYIRNGAQWWGRPATEKYLLTGMGRCSCCGKSITVLGGNNGTSPHRVKAYYYGCSYNHTRGETICANDHKARMQWLDGAVIRAIEQTVLTPQAIEYTIEEAVREQARLLEQNPDKPRQLEAEERRVRKELARFLQLIGEGKAPESVLVEITRREERLKQLERERQALEEPIPVHDTAGARVRYRESLGRFKDLLLGDVPVARQALRRLLIEPLRLFPTTIEGRKTLRFEGVTTLGPLLDPSYKGVATPRGFEPRLPP